MIQISIYVIILATVTLHLFILCYLPFHLANKLVICAVRRIRWIRTAEALLAVFMDTQRCHTILHPDNQLHYPR